MSITSLLRGKMMQDTIRKNMLMTLLHWSFPLKPGKMTVPLDPTKAHFRTPNLNE